MVFFFCFTSPDDEGDNGHFFLFYSNDKTTTSRFVWWVLLSVVSRKVRFEVRRGAWGVGQRSELGAATDDGQSRDGRWQDGKFLRVQMDPSIPSPP